MYNYRHNHYKTKRKSLMLTVELGPLALAYNTFELKLPLSLDFLQSEFKLSLDVMQNLINLL